MDVVKAGEAATEDLVVGWRIIGVGEVAAELRQSEGRRRGELRRGRRCAD